MYVDLLSTRLERLKKTNSQIAALDAIRLVRLYVLGDVAAEEVLDDAVLEEGLAIFRAGRPPFQDPAFLEKLHWRRCADILRDFLKELRRSGLEDGSLDTLVDDIGREKALVHHLSRSALDRTRETLEFFASKYRIEPDLLRMIGTTPLLPAFAKLRAKLPAQEGTAFPRFCPVCGASFTLGVYQAGTRFLLCGLCGHRVHVDFFFCSSCGTTDPGRLAFLKPEEEPALQVDYCRQCGSYLKSVQEDLIGAVVEDPVLLDLSTMDLDPLGREAVKEPVSQSS